MTNTFIYFTPTNLDIIEELKKQASEVCRQAIPKKWITGCLSDFTFGFIHLTPVAQIGATRRYPTRKRVYSFVLCKQTTHNCVDVRLICARARSKEGSLLLDRVEKFAKEEKMEILSLSSLPEYRLVDWYKQKGFHIKTDIHDPKTYELKLYYMEKNLK